MDKVVCKGTLPLIISPKDASEFKHVSDVANWLESNKVEVESLLQMHGAILFRGFPLQTAFDFSDFVTSFAYIDLPYDESLSFAVRKVVTKNVCTTNEGKRGGMVFHHEQAAAPYYPSKVFFFCEEPATIGGGTGVCASWTIVDALKREYPEFYQTCKDLGVIYRGCFPSEHDTGAIKGTGRSWKSFFAVETRDQCDARMKVLGYEPRWEGEVLHFTTPVLSAIRTVPGPKGEETEVFFNQMVAQAFSNAIEFSATSSSSTGEGAQNDSSIEFASFHLTFGDGSPVPMKQLHFIKEFTDKQAVDICWEKGDVALLDNFLVMHARREFEGPRKVLASLVK
jgi:alpha-ketoglutarate-dependent taurine dioxygenase